MKIKKNIILKQSMIKLVFCSSFILMVSVLGCVVPYEGTMGIYEDILVVNAIITNENKRQEVTLTRSYSFDEDGPKAEINAKVSVLTGDGEEYQFEEIKPGIYLSLIAFSAEMGKGYKLFIITASGKSYSSTSMKLPVNTTSIDDVYAKRIVNNDGEDGIAIYINSFDPTGNSKYYRHEFIETFKIIAPNWSPYDIVLLGEGELQDYYSIILREQEERVCYGKNTSKNIILNSTISLNEDRLKNYEVRFINRNDYIITYRYSVLVRQYVQTPETFSYYETLKGLSRSSDNIFSEDQPGFLAGNIFALDDAKENVAGFFEVSTVSEKRLFFNYEDFFAGEELPPYDGGCFTFAPSAAGRMGERELTNLIKSGSVRYYGYNNNPAPNEGGVLLTTPKCGDCTVLGSNKVPDFWIE